jgi:hypothetical protein
VDFRGFFWLGLSRAFDDIGCKIGGKRTAAKQIPSMNDLESNTRQVKNEADEGQHMTCRKLPNHARYGVNPYPHNAPLDLHSPMEEGFVLIAFRAVLGMVLLLPFAILMIFCYGWFKYCIRFWRALEYWN